MEFSNETRLNPEQFEDSIPVIHGQDFYIDEQGYVSTYNREPVTVFDSYGNSVVVTSFKPVTDFIYIVNNKLGYKVSTGIMVTEIPATKENYKGGFQGIVGFNETETNYQYLNNKSTQSTINFTGRINSSKQLEIYLEDSDTWVVPLGEFRCYISGTAYNINYSSVLPNSFGDTFTVTLATWTSVDISPSTNYIRDALVCGNTLYLSCRLNIIGSEPYNWNNIDTSSSTVIWSEDSRLTGCYFHGSPTASSFWMVNYNTSSCYYVSGDELSVLQEYEHKLPIIGAGHIDKFLLAVVDKEGLSILSAYVSLNTWLIKVKAYFKFNQLSAYEDILTQYQREQVTYVQDLDSLVIQSNQRANMMFYILADKIKSGCHTIQEVIPGDYSCYAILDNQLLKYTKVEDSGEYEPIDKDAGVTAYNSWIYIGSDLEPDMGGSTMRDTEIIFEGKISITEGSGISVESSSDRPKDTKDLPIRTNQTNPDNWWYLYTKTLRYPISYTDWVRISMMPTTKIFNITLTKSLEKTDKKGKK